MRSHNAEHYGTKVVRSLLPGRAFPFPKSLYAVEDALRLFVSKKPDALVLDFFAGSGTTAHAVMRLNRQDGGRRRSVSITNNEVASKEAATLRKDGLRPGDSKWESRGICEQITKPRIRAAATGMDPDGNPISDHYKFVDESPMDEGFDENIEFFDLTYEDPTLIELDLAFERVAPLLWMRAGAQGHMIEARTDDFAIAECYAILFQVDACRDFLAEIEKKCDAKTVFIVTDDESQFQAIASQLPRDTDVVRLYESYLRTFQINTGRT